MEITLPNCWRPRGYQQRLWRYLETGGKRAVAVWHRRAGKDEVCLHWAACAAMQRVGNYWHMLPEASQARKAVWDAINPHTGRRRIDEAFPPSIRIGQRDDDMRIKLINGSSWQLVGSDNFNSLVGQDRKEFNDRKLAVNLAALCDSAIGAVNRYPDPRTRDFIDRLCGGDGQVVTMDRLTELLRTLDQLNAAGS